MSCHPREHLARIQPLHGPVIERALGTWYVDTSGKRHLDMLSGCWCNVLGHNHPEFIRRLKRQVGRLIHLGTGYLSGEVGDGATALLSTLPPEAAPHRVAFVNTGSEAVDLAVKMAKAATGRQGVVSFERGYYGASTSVYHYMGLPKSGFMGVAEGCHRFLAPDCIACPVGLTHPACGHECLTVSEDRLRYDVSSPDGVAAILFEPIISAGGMLFPPPGYLERLAQTAGRLGALLIANEVTTGVGRTGRWFAYQHSPIQPDAIAFGKGFGNGLPVAGVLMTAEVEEAAHGAGLVHIQSHQSDPLSGFAVSAVIGLIRELGLLERVTVMGEEIMAALQKTAIETGAIRDVRGQGLMLAFTAVCDSAALHAELTARGIITCLRPAYETFQLMPPYTIAGSEVDYFIAALSDSLDAVRRRESPPSGTKHPEVEKSSGEVGGDEIV